MQHGTPVPIPNQSTLARKPGRSPTGASRSAQARGNTSLFDGGNGPFKDPSSPPRRAWNQRVTNEELVAAYKDTGSIWKAAKRLGLCGQSVHERLRRLGYEMAHQSWTADEVAEAWSLAGQGEPMALIANRLGRTYIAVALKLSRLGIGSQHKGWRWKPRRKMILSKKRVSGFAKKLERGTATVRRLARQQGVR